VSTLLSPHIPTFIFSLINLGILYWALKKLLFKPVTEFMENRTKSIEDNIQNAKQKNAEADKLKKDYEDQLLTARGQVDSLIKEAREKATKEYEGILAQAKEDSQTMLEKARADIENERQQMIKSIRNEVASLALAAASKVIEANMDNDKNRAIVEKFIDEEGAA
jgi:F-type H+-transporting ATPase subunit b